jgi:hypothetical protein
MIRATAHALLSSKNPPGGPPYPLRSPSQNGKNPALETEKTDREHIDPEKQLDMFPLVQGHQGDASHQLDFQDFVELNPGPCRIECESSSQTYPYDKRKQHAHRRTPRHAQFIARSQQRNQHRTRCCSGKRQFGGKAKSQLVRVHHTEPRPQHHANPGMTKHKGQDCQDDAHYQQVTHASFPNACRGAALPRPDVPHWPAHDPDGRWENCPQPPFPSSASRSGEANSRFPPLASNAAIRVQPLGSYPRPSKSLGLSQAGLPQTCGQRSVL